MSEKEVVEKEVADSDAVVFKKKKKGKKDKKKHRRTQQTKGDVGLEDNDTSEKLETVRDDLKYRTREKGVNVEELLKKKEEHKEDEIVEQYGLIQTKQTEEDEFGNVIQTSFAEETGRQERDRAMLKFVNRKLQEEEGLGGNKTELSEYEKLQQKLWEVPDHLKTRERKDEITKGMLSSELLRGVPEVKSGLLNKVTAAHDAKYKKKGSAAKNKHVQKSHLFETILKGMKKGHQQDYSSARFEKGTATNSIRKSDYRDRRDYSDNRDGGKRRSGANERVSTANEPKKAHAM
eukprot:m.25372 g.25372  ORF g.25372 m.25372 type:complete len:291 (-) comp9189_c0_seq1:139-1011(-)